MELLAVRFETDCKDGAQLRPAVERIRRARELRRAQVRKGAIGFDLYVHVRPGVSAGRAQSLVRPLLPPGVLVSRTFEVMGERSEEEDDERRRRDDADESGAGIPGQGSAPGQG
jgi:hypothetical protein